MIYYGGNDYRDYLAHYGVKGMKWGKHLFDWYDSHSGGRLTTILNTRKTANQIRKDSKTGGRYRTNWRRANLVNKGITPTPNYSGSFGGNTKREELYPFSQNYNYRMNYAIKKHGNTIADNLDRNADRTPEVRTINFVKNAARKISSFTKKTINKGKRALSKLFGKKKTGVRPHSRKKKYTGGLAYVFKRRRAFGRR